jgi:hypothetical protein
LFTYQQKESTTMDISTLVLIAVCFALAGYIFEGE